MENMDDAELSRSNDITIEELKPFPMFAHFSDEQAAEAIRAIKKFSYIVLYDYLKNKNDGQ